MQAPALPLDEDARLLRLLSFDVLDTPPDPGLDALTGLAARLLNAPIALVSLVDGQRQWFKSRHGLAATETPREISLCGHVVATGQALVVADASLDHRFADNPLVAGPLAIRFYCGYPLHAADGSTLGTLCVIDHEPRTLTPEQGELLAQLAQLAVMQLEHHRDRLALAAQQRALQAHAERSAKVELELRELTASAERSSHAKTEFLANMSHEIRTPMNAIMGMGELLLSTPLSEKQRKHVESLRSAGAHLLDLIDDVLDVAKIEAGKLEVDSTPFTLRALVRSIENLMQVRALETGVKLVCHVAVQGDDTLLGDLGRLRQVLVNLVGNAFKFTERGRITLLVTRVSGDEYQFDVTDTGMGIPHDRQQAIFESFTQADNSTTRRYGGTGLGLTISRALVELMGGRMWLESSPGKGSKFSFSAQLPTESVVALGALPRVDPGPPLPTWPPTTGGELAGGGSLVNPGICLLLGDHLSGADVRILVVDDVEHNCELVTAFLEQFPWRLDFASNGREAVEKCEQVDYDLVFMDVQMPIMDGYDATRLIRAREAAQSKQRVPIVALTAHVMGAEMKRCFEAGCDGHLGKPISRAALVNAVIDFARAPGKHAVARFPTAAPGASVASPPAEIAHLVPRYLEACRERLAQLQSAARQGDFAAVTQHAHNLRGTGGAFGFPPITELAAQLEEAAQLGDQALAERRIGDLQHYLAT